MIQGMDLAFAIQTEPQDNQIVGYGKFLFIEIFQPVNGERKDYKSTIWQAIIKQYT